MSLVIDCIFSILQFIERPTIFGIKAKRPRFYRIFSFSLKRLRNSSVSGISALIANGVRESASCWNVTWRNPPTLDMLAKEVRCSSFYLSRIFVQYTSTSIPRYLRIKRVEKAAELLRTGKISVTEAAMTVGYSSLSSFNKAFVDHFGCCPGLYPHAKNLLKNFSASRRKKGQG